MLCLWLVVFAILPGFPGVFASPTAEVINLPGGQAARRPGGGAISLWRCH